MGVSIDTPSNPSADILTLVHTGGKDFLDRLSTLAAQTAAHDAALKDLNLGKDAKAAYTEAANLKIQATQDRQAAADALTAAKAEAARITAEASTYAAQAKQDWQAKVAKLNATLAQMGS